MCPVLVWYWCSRCGSVVQPRTWPSALHSPQQAELQKRAENRAGGGDQGPFGSSAEEVLQSSNWRHSLSGEEFIFFRLCKGYLARQELNVLGPSSKTSRVHGTGIQYRTYQQRNFVTFQASHEHAERRKASTEPLTRENILLQMRLI